MVFAPSAPAEYNAVLNSKLDAGSAGDLITCRPFDASLELYNKGKLADLTGLAAMANFSPVAKSAWQTDDAAATFCVPMASVIHGFIYNADAFAALGIEVPTTEAEFFAALDKIKADGTYIPMAMGTNDQWEAATMGYNNIGPNYWKGEEGRLALIKGEQKLTDPQWVAPFTQLARWKDYLGDGFEAQTYPDSQNLFTLGRAAIYPAGSWEISGFNTQAGFKMGAFPPPVAAAGDTCYISDHTDIALGLNAASPNADQAKVFLEWIGSPEFATLYANALPGFFSLNSTPVEMADPLAKEFVGWRDKCQSTIRSTYQILSRGTPNLGAFRPPHPPRVFSPKRRQVPKVRARSRFSVWQKADPLAHRRVPGPGGAGLYRHHDRAVVWHAEPVAVHPGAGADKRIRRPGQLPDAFW